MGHGKSLITFFSKSTILHLNFSPLIVSLIGGADLNCGALQSLRPDLEKLIDPIRKSIPQSSD
jgi:hypothetical protein